MRIIDSKFEKDLLNGCLSPLFSVVKLDPSLNVELRGNYINIYYRGGSLYKITQQQNGYKFEFDTGYFLDGIIRNDNDNLIALGKKLYSDAEYSSALPYLKHAMNRYIAEKKSFGEKEAQQYVVYENNRSAIANQTAYYIADLEYANKNARFDLGGIRWDNKRFNKAKLVIIEAKFGEKAVKGGHADIAKHLDDAIALFENRRSISLDDLKDEMRLLFNQKQRLGLIHKIGDSGIKELAKTDIEDRGEFMILLSNFPPKSIQLKAVLESIKDKILAINNFDFVIANASNMGYGLYSEKIILVKKLMGWQ